MFGSTDQYRKALVNCRSIALTALMCTALSACGNSSTPGSSGNGTQQAPQQMTTTVTSTTTSADTGPTTTVDVRREVEPNPPVDANNTTVEMGNDDSAQPTAPVRKGTHVDLPGVKVDSDSADDKVDIKAPFVHIHKDGQGHTHIKVPFVNIHTNDND